MTMNDFDAEESDPRNVPDGKNPHTATFANAIVGLLYFLVAAFVCTQVWNHTIIVLFPTLPYTMFTQVGGIILALCVMTKLVARILANTVYTMLLNLVIAIAKANANLGTQRGQTKSEDE